MTIKVYESRMFAAYREAEESKNDEIFAVFYTPMDSIRAVRNCIIQMAKEEAIKKIQAGGGIKILEQYVLFTGIIESRLSENFNRWYVIEESLQTLILIAEEKADLLFKDEED
jgi:hypothetical protein